MSAKVYNGHRLASGTDLLALCERVRALADPVRDRLDAVALTAAATTLIDKTRLGVPLDHEVDRALSPSSIALQAYHAERRSFAPDTRHHDPHALTFALARRTPRWLALNWYGAQDYAPVFAALCGEFDLEPYAYWSGPGRPDDISEQQWEQRRAFWDIDEPLSRLGLTFALRPDFRVAPQVRACANAVPPPQSRAASIAGTLIGCVYPKPSAEDAMSLAMDIVFGRSDASRGLIQALVPALSPINDEDLSMPLADIALDAVARDRAVEAINAFARERMQVV